MRRSFRRRRRSADLALMCSVQRRTIEALSGRLDLVQRDAEIALQALTEAESRIADLEARAFGSLLARYTPLRKTWLAEPIERS